MKQLSAELVRAHAFVNGSLIQLEKTEAKAERAKAEIESLHDPLRMGTQRAAEGDAGDRAGVAMSRPVQRLAGTPSICLWRLDNGDRLLCPRSSRGDRLRAQFIAEVAACIGITMEHEGQRG